MRDPSAYGFAKKPELPPLNIRQVTIDSGITDGLLPKLAQSLGDRLTARRDTVAMRCAAAAELANSIDGPVLVWCNLNDESQMLAGSINGAVEVSGSDKPELKESRIIGFTNNTHRVLVTKPKIAGFGMNWQHCHNMIFVGLSDSWEQYYQAIRRCWRFGQTQTVNVYVVTADIEGMVVENIKRKDDQSDRMMDDMASIAKDFFDDYSKASNALRAYKPQMAAPLPKFI